MPRQYSILMEHEIFRLELNFPAFEEDHFVAAMDRADTFIYLGRLNFVGQLAHEA